MARVPGPGGGGGQQQNGGMASQIQQDIERVRRQMEEESQANQQQTVESSQRTAENPFGGMGPAIDVGRTEDVPTQGEVDVDIPGGRPADQQQTQDNQPSRTPDQTQNQSISTQNGAPTVDVSERFQGGQNLQQTGTPQADTQRAPGPQASTQSTRAPEQSDARDNINQGIVQDLTTGGFLAETGPGFDPLSGEFLPTEEQLGEASRGFSEATGSVANFAADSLITTPEEARNPGQTNQGLSRSEELASTAIQSGLQFGNVPQWLQSAETGTEVATNLPGQLAENPTETAQTLAGVADVATQTAAQEAAENPAETAASVFGGTIAGFGVSRAIQRAPGFVRGARIRAQGGDIVDFEDLSDPPTTTEGYGLPGFTREAQADPDVARSEFLEQASQNPLAGDSPVAFHGRSPEGVSEFGGFGPEFEAPEGGSELPGLFQSADLSPLRIEGAGDSGGLPSIGLPRPRVTSSRVLAEQDVDVGITEGQTRQQVGGFLQDAADRGKSFIRTDEGGPTPEQEAIAPPGSQFVETDGIFGIRAGDDVIPGRLMERDTADTNTGGPEGGPFTRRDIARETSEAIRESRRRQASQPDYPFLPQPFGAPDTGQQDPTGTGDTTSPTQSGTQSAGPFSGTPTAGPFGGAPNYGPTGDTADTTRPPSDTSAPSDPFGVFTGTFGPSGDSTSSGPTDTTGPFGGPTSGGPSGGPSDSSGGPTSPPPFGPPTGGPTDTPSEPPSSPPPFGPPTSPPGSPPGTPGTPGNPPGNPSRPRILPDRSDDDEDEETFSPLGPTGQDFQNPVVGGFEFLFGSGGGGGGNRQQSAEPLDGAGGLFSGNIDTDGSGAIFGFGANDGDTQDTLGPFGGMF